MPNWVEGKIVDSRQWTDQLCSLYIEAPVSDFEAGQFTTLALDIDGTRIAHPYSFVSSPSDPVLEFYFNVVPKHSIVSRVIKNNMKLNRLYSSCVT